MRESSTDEADGVDVSRRNLLAMATAATGVGLAGCTGPSTDCHLAITSKTIQDNFAWGGQGTYEITVCNDSMFFNCDGAPITIEDDLPAGFTFDSVAAPWTASAAGGVVTATNDTYTELDPGACLTLELTVDVPAAGQFPGTPPVENCATGTYKDGPVAVRPGSCVTHGFEGPTPTPTASPTETPADPATPIDSPTPTEGRPTATPTEHRPTATPTETSTATPTDSPTATATEGRPTPTPTETSTPTETPTPTPREGRPTPTPTDPDRG